MSKGTRTAVDTEAFGAERAEERFDPPPSSARWWQAVVVGMLIAMPLTWWLLAYAGTLPFLIGLFFFVLFGLIFGAVMHRVAAPHRPYTRRTLVAGTAMVVGFVWGMTLVKESRDVPRVLAKNALTLTRSLGDRTPAQFTEEVTQQIHTFLERQYPPGGTLGYIQWMATSGKIAKGELPDVSRTLTRPQARMWYVIRIVLSVVFLAFGISSQTLALKLRAEPSLHPMAATGGRDKV